MDTKREAGPKSLIPERRIKKTIRSVMISSLRLHVDRDLSPPPLLSVPVSVLVIPLSTPLLFSISLPLSLVVALSVPPSVSLSLPLSVMNICFSSYPFLLLLYWSLLPSTPPRALVHTLLCLTCTASLLLPHLLLIVVVSLVIFLVLALLFVQRLILPFLLPLFLLILFFSPPFFVFVVWVWRTGRKKRSLLMNNLFICMSICF